ncbi:MAG TPA: phosphoethanolamine transferase, partial [Albitalea sp.]|nr:phosphoethanolamine transferase [Albitalea sp.]
FDLLAVFYTFKSTEVIDAVRPYIGMISIMSLVLLVPLGLLWRGDIPRPSHRIQLTVILAGLALAVSLPNHVWLNAWPIALVPAALAAQSSGVGIELPPTANIRMSPRDRYQSWKASREEKPSDAETYVLIIGESVRSDRINGCGGRAQITAPPAGSLVYCDVLSGASSTHASVPLLVSRELPGHMDRVSHDTTFLNAFEAAGFETFWLSVQERSIAWPDARNQFYDLSDHLDRDTLLPLLDQALAKAAPRKLIVLHAYNSHAPYTERYQEATAPLSVDKKLVESKLPTKAAIGMWWNAYDNSIDESMRLLDEVVSRLRAQNGHAFFVFTSDHEENMLDDRRNLVQHALKFPTLWDTRVPAIVWANTAWRRSNPERWRALVLNQCMPLMHMDFVPTILGAARIKYEEGRNLPIDLTLRLANSRKRITQVRSGESVTSDILDQEAWLAGQ